MMYVCRLNKANNVMITKYALSFVHIHVYVNDGEEFACISSMGAKIFLFRVAEFHTHIYGT